MHLKLQINLTGCKTPFATRTSSPIWLLALVELATILSLLISTGIKCTVLANQDDVALKELLAAPHQRKCEPMLNIVLPQKPHTMTTRAAIYDEGASMNISNGSSEKASETTNAAQSTARGLPKSFTFAIDNIDMPLTQTGSPVQSVMRLLSAFDSQLDGGDENDDASEEEIELDANGQRVPAPRENSIRFVQNKLYISNLNLTMLNIHLYAEGQPKFGLGINIGNATLAGRFAYNGLMPSLMGGNLISKLAGHYRMSIDNVLVAASSNLTKQRDAGESQLYRLATSDLRMNISNLGYISIDILDATDSSKPTSNYVLKMLQRVLQKTIKRTYNKFEEYIRQTLEVEGRRFLDCELTRFSPILSENQREGHELFKSDEKANNLDDLARILSSEIRNSRLDRVGLANFEYQRSLLGTNALIVFTNGSLSGLDNLRLLGETRIKLQDEHLIVNASLGWFNLKPQYNWTLYWGSSAQSTQLVELQRQDQAAAAASKQPMAKGFVSATIKAIEFDTLISYRGLKFTNQSSSQNRVSVDELNIRRLDGPKMDIGGLPGMNRLTRATVNFFMGRLKQRLVSSIQPSLKLELERALNRLAPLIR